MMNYTTAIFLMNSNVRTVIGIYEDDEGGKKSVPRTMFKTLDPDIKVGDYVLVPTTTRHRMTVNKVVDVDTEVDYDSTVQVGWVIGKVDRSAYDATIAMESRAIEAVKSAEKRRKQDELKASLIKDNPDLVALQMVALPGATIDHDMPTPRTPLT